MKYLAVLGRQPEISIAELESLFGKTVQFASFLAGSVFVFSPMAQDSVGDLQALSTLDERLIDRLGGALKLAVQIEERPIEYLQKLPEGKITIGVSDYSEGASRKTALNEALKLKKMLVRHGRSVRVVDNKDAILSTATSLHNGLAGKNLRKVELIKVDDSWYRVIGVQDIDDYAKRDQARPARDAYVGMLPPKLAQILINLCGPLEPGSTVLDPFCGTGVVLQEALLMGYRAYGTDVSERMVEYSKKNLEWLIERYMLSGAGVAPARHYGGRAPRYLGRNLRIAPDRSIFSICQGDATSFTWGKPIDAVACEGYLGKPFSQIPTEMELKSEMQECKAIVIGFLKNLARQVKIDTPVVIAVPAWLRESGDYARLGILDGIEELGYNVSNKSHKGLLYHRERQIVARDILILRKK